MLDHLWVEGISVTCTSDTVTGSLGGSKSKIDLFIKQLKSSVLSQLVNESGERDPYYRYL